MTSKLVLMILALLGVAGIVFTAKCPGKTSIDPCTCRDHGKNLELFCSDRDMNLDELKKILSVFNTEDTLDLDFYYINLGTVPTDYFKGFNIRVINFSNCKYEQIPDEEGRVLVGLEDTLEEFMVIRTIEKHNSPAVLDLSHLKKLNSMHLGYNSIPELSDNWFKKGPSSLTYLSIMGNEIEKLGSKAFANLPNLEYLNVEDNQFGEMKRSMLPNPATYLKELHLNENGLKSLPEDFVTEMPALTHLSLQRNDLTHIPQETFERIWGQLEVLSLPINKLNCEDSTLKWMVDSEHTPKIYGLCETPAKRRNNKISDVIEELRRGDNHKFAN